MPPIRRRTTSRSGRVTRSGYLPPLHLQLLRRERPDGVDRRRVGEGGDVDRAELAGGDRQGAVERIGAVMGADDVAVLLARGADEGSAMGGIGRAPDDRLRVLAAGVGVRGQDDVLLHRVFDRELRSAGVLPNLTEWSSSAYRHQSR